VTFITVLRAGTNRTFVETDERVIGQVGRQQPKRIAMSIKTKFAALAVAAVVATSAIATTTPASAGPFKGPGIGLGVGLATGLVVGSALAASQPAYPGYPVHHCWWQPEYNVFHQYIGSQRVCSF
jgi:hypothetical protein